MSLDIHLEPGTISAWVAASIAILSAILTWRWQVYMGKRNSARISIIPRIIYEIPKYNLNIELKNSGDHDASNIKIELFELILKKENNMETVNYDNYICFLEALGRENIGLILILDIDNQHFVKIKLSYDDIVTMKKKEDTVYICYKYNQNMKCWQVTPTSEKHFNELIKTEEKSKFRNIFYNIKRYF